MKVVITGANGMLGGSLCQLYHNKHQVYALHRDEKCLTTCAGDYILDLLDRVQLKNIVDTIRPDIFIHCAGLTNIDVCENSPEKAYASNVDASENVALACRDKTKVVFVSTDQIYGDNKDRSESSSSLRPVNYYGYTKLCAEKKIKTNCPGYIIIRTNIFGWSRKNDNISFAEWIYQSLEQGRSISLFDDYIFSPIYTNYLGEVILKLIEIDFSGIINIGSPNSWSKYMFGRTMAESRGFDVRLITKASILSHSFLAKRPSNLSLAVNKASNLGIELPNCLMSLSRFLGDKN